MSCSRAWLVALRRQARAVPDVHMTIGRISATQSSRFRSAPRRRPPRHPRRRARRLMPTPAARMRPAAISPSWCTAPGGIPERDDDDSGRDGDLHRSPCHAAPLPGHRSKHVGRRSRSFPPDQAGVGVVRLTTAGGGAPNRHAMQPRFLVTARTRGTALAIFPAGPGRGRRSETHDGRGGAPRGSGPRSVRRSPG